jgi:ABC-2 type transport system ATP-binding protein
MRALSGGMKRRVLVAQALVHRPPVIVLDEPTAGVDVELRQALWQFIRRLNRAGHTIVLTTHYLEEAQELCGRIAMLKQGRVVALDRTDTLLGRLAGGTLSLRLSGAPMPPALAARFEADPVSDGRLRLPVARYEEIEPVLAALREAGCRIEEMELLHTDLEDVFVKTMQSSAA